MRFSTYLSALVFLLSPAVLCAQPQSVAPQGQYAEIDTRLANDTITVLLSGSRAEKAAVIKRIKNNSKDYAPPVFYALSRVLFEQGDKDQASFWFYAGQLRGRFDANICTDSSARQAIAVLNQNFGTPINQYMFQDLAKLENLIPKVLEWDRATRYNYDHRWINLHGMNAMLSGMNGKPPPGAPAALSLPKDQWEAIAEKTREEYLSGFNEAVEKMKNQAPAK